MKSKTSDWYECIVKYDKTQDDGSEKNVTETYVVDALTFTEAEARILDEMKPYFVQDFKIKNINPAQYKEVFFSEMEKDDKYWKVKMAYLTLDENTMKEKRTPATYLVQAERADVADSYIREIMGQTALDYVVTGVTETKIQDVYTHNSK